MYELALDNSQEYKEGHFIIEKSYIILVAGLPGDKNFIPYFKTRQISYIQEEDLTSDDFATSDSDFGYQSLSSNNTSNYNSAPNAFLPPFGNIVNMARFATFNHENSILTSSTLSPVISSLTSTTQPTSIENEQRSHRREFNNNSGIFGTRQNRYGLRTTIQIRGATNFSRFSSRNRTSR